MSADGNMCRLETLLVNSWARSLSLRWFELPTLRRLGLDLRGRDVLEVGCGSGHGAAKLVRQCGAAHVLATDVVRDFRVYHERVTYRVLDVCRPGLAPGSVDAVVSLACLHHVADWRRAVREIATLLRPGGPFGFWDFTATGLDRWLWRTFFQHPKGERFTADELRGELRANGLRPRGERAFWFGDLIFGVWEKEAA